MNIAWLITLFTWINYHIINIDIVRVIRTYCPRTSSITFHESDMLSIIRLGMKQNDLLLMDMTSGFFNFERIQDRQTIMSQKYPRFPFRRHVLFFYIMLPSRRHVFVWWSLYCIMLFPLFNFYLHQFLYFSNKITKRAT